MKRLKFLETKRTPRYSLRKFSVGVAQVLLGVTIFGINFTNHSVKAATMQQTSAVGNTAAKVCCELLFAELLKLSTLSVVAAFTE